MAITTETLIMVEIRHSREFAIVADLSFASSNKIEFIIAEYFLLGQIEMQSKIDTVITLHAKLDLLQSDPDKFEQDVLSGAIDVNMVDANGYNLLGLTDYNLSKNSIRLLIKLGIDLDHTEDISKSAWLFGKYYKVVERFYEVVKENEKADH